MGAALINPDIVRWAKERAGFTTEELQQKVHSKFHLWEEGEARPTFKQAQKIAKKLHIPFGYLYLKSPPVETLPAPDLRSRSDLNYGEFSIDLRDTLHDAIRKQEWYKEYLYDLDIAELDFPGKFKLGSDVKEIAASITSTLKLSLDHRNDLNKNMFLRYLTDQAENTGILVMRSGKVGNNTRRVLNTEEFLGFALPDKRAPLIFINAADYPSSQIFTFIHELAHIWIGAKGVSNSNLGTTGSQISIERYCNKVAGEVLAPRKNLRSLWDKAIPLSENAEALAETFTVSSAVVARAALTYKLCTEDEFFNYYDQIRNEWRKRRERRKSTGGNSHNTFPVANSNRLVNAVLSQTMSGNMLYRDAARLLNTTPHSLHNYASTKGIV